MRLLRCSLVLAVLAILLAPSGWAAQVPGPPDSAGPSGQNGKIDASPEAVARFAQLLEALTFVKNSLPADFTNDYYAGIRLRYGYYKSNVGLFLPGHLDQAEFDVTEYFPDHDGSDPDRCYPVKTYTVLLNTLDPTSVKAIGGSSGKRTYLVFQTRNNTRAITVRQSLYWFHENPGCNGSWSDDTPLNKLQLQFDDADTRDRAVKALKVAIELSGGKASSF